jgi:hypothetical protein
MKRRRVRIVAGAALLAFTLTIGGAVIATTIEDEGAVEPAQIGSTVPSTIDDCELLEGDDSFGSAPEGCELVGDARYVEPGQYFVRPVDTGHTPPRPGDIEAWFVIPGNHWYWWGGGVGKAHQLGGPEWEPYIRVSVNPIMGVPRQKCEPATPDQEALPTSIMSVAQAIVASSRIDVLEGPRRVQQFGHDAVHAQFTVTRPCPDDKPFLLWRAFESAPGHSGDIYAPLGEDDIWDGTADHVFDVWVVDVQGEQLVVCADHTVARNADLAEMRELLDSIRFEFSE